jgi:nitrate/nitrite sensing protein/histidine kinase/DNA gyrase B/HSP90-like ATPase
MGSRGRSIRLRIYFLVAIPLITMLGLFGFVAYSSVTNWLNQDRAPNLINATSEPLTNFVNKLQAERRAAVVYLSDRSSASLSAYRSAIAVTRQGQVQLEAAFNSAGTKDSTTPDETAAIAKMTADLKGMTSLREGVEAGKLAPLAGLVAYTNVIAEQGAVLQAEASSITNVPAVEQGLALISGVNTQEDVSEQDAVLAGALARGSLTNEDRVAFSQAGGRLQDDTMLYEEFFTPAELNTYNTTLNSLAPQSLQKQLTTIQEAIPAGVRLSTLEAGGLAPASWERMTKTWLQAASRAGTAAASAVLTANESTAIDAKRRVWETGAIGAAGLILTLIVTILLGRSINRRLTMLRRSALTLAGEQLPAVVARLRRGEDVDVAAEAPPLRAGNDEIGQVGQAIDTVRQTAIRSAVEEARLRQGVNDVFRNLARRNQSLLQRQLSVLDGMERKATDPDVLEDLFKMDHLTTRMRRHAEGLIILSGAAPGRAWSAPVKLVDVMRGAVAEVEDYARVAVATQSKAALSGSAVTDVIHMLAELIENATTLSPPFTQVRVSGETVGNGFAIEIEDRGLGMTPQRMAELNERLANPPDINPANTEQLGLFVVGQLARRHGIGVTLRPSPYGGITAVALIPQRLIVEDGPAAITAGGRGTAAVTGAGVPGFADSADPAAFAGPPGFGGPPATDPPGFGGPPAFADSAAFGAPGFADPPGFGGPYRGEGGSYGSDGGYAGSYEPGGNGTAYPDQPPFPGFPPPPVPAAPPAPGSSPAPGSPPDLDSLPIGPDPYAGNPSGARRGRHGASDVPVVTGVPVSRPVTSSFDVFTPVRPPEGDDAAPGGLDDAPYAESYTDYGGGSYGTGSQSASPRGDEGYGNNGGADGGLAAENAGGGNDADYKGLPRRVRQANLAPQLRSSAVAGSNSTAGVPRATSASLSDMRNTLSAMQRGWQQGRAQSQPDSEGGADGD